MAVDRHPGRVRAARREHGEHRHNELAEPRVQIWVLEPETGDPAHPPVFQSPQSPLASLLNRTWPAPGCEEANTVSPVRDTGEARRSPLDCAGIPDRTAPMSTAPCLRSGSEPDAPVVRSSRKS